MYVCRGHRYVPGTIYMVKPLCNAPYTTHTESIAVLKLKEKLENYKSGDYINMGDYKAFIPSKINYNWGWDDIKLDKLLA